MSAEHPILCVAPVVRAILRGDQTQDRRPIRCLSRGFSMGWSDARQCDWPMIETADGEWREHPGPWVPGDLLYGREGFFAVAEGIGYSADRTIIKHPGVFDDVPHPSPHAEEIARWLDVHGESGRPNIHHPKWAARIWLRVLSVRPELVQEISDEDTYAEGITEADAEAYWHDGPQPVAVFADLWDSLYLGTDYDWATNPWVWRTVFELVSSTGRRDVR